MFQYLLLYPQALVPVTTEVEVPFELHRYIIGQKGSGIRKMMDEFEVRKSSFIVFFYFIFFYVRGVAEMVLIQDTVSSVWMFYSTL